MKIAYEHQTFTSQSYGGISRYYSNLVSGLLQLRQDASVFAGLHRNHYLEGLPKTALHGVKVFPYPPKTGPIFHGFNHCLTQLQIMCWQPDVIHETYYSSIPRFGGDAIRVITALDMIHEKYPDNFPLNDRTTQRKKITFDRVDHIISISQSTKNDLVELFDIDESKISVVHLGVATPNVNSLIKPAVNTRPFLLYVGARGGYKNFSLFVSAFAGSTELMREFDLVAFGGGAFTPDELVSFEKHGFRQLQVKQVSGNDRVLSSLYSGAVAFVYPSLYEGFGMPPLEAMAAGCPVVCSNSSSMPEVVNDAGEYFNPSDMDEMRCAIETVCFSSALRDSLIAAGFENVKDFAWEKCAQQTLGVYQMLADQI